MGQIVWKGWATSGSTMKRTPKTPSPALKSQKKLVHQQQAENETAKFQGTKRCGTSTTCCFLPHAVLTRALFQQAEGETIN